MVEGCGGHTALDTRLPGHRIVVCHCVVEGAELFIPHSMDGMDLVLVGDPRRPFTNRI